MTKETITPIISEIIPKPENEKWYVRIGRKADTRRPRILSRAYFKKIK